MNRTSTIQALAFGSVMALLLALGLNVWTPSTRADVGVSGGGTGNTINGLTNNDPGSWTNGGGLTVGLGTNWMALLSTPTNATIVEDGTNASGAPVSASITLGAAPAGASALTLSNGNLSVTGAIAGASVTLTNPATGASFNSPTNQPASGQLVVATGTNGSTAFANTIPGPLTVGTNANTGQETTDKNGNHSDSGTNSAWLMLRDGAGNVFFQALGSADAIIVSNLIVSGKFRFPQISATGVLTNNANGEIYSTPTLPVALMAGGPSVFSGNSGSIVLPVSGTYFFAPNSSFTNVTADTAGITRSLMPAGQVIASWVATSANPGAVANTFTVMTNGVATGQVITLNNVTTGSDSAHPTIPFLAGTELGVKIVTLAGTAVRWEWGILVRVTTAF